MTALDVMALFSLAMMVVMGVLLFVFLGSLPGRIAKERGHPHANAINIGGWATLVLALVGWPFVLMWAMSETTGRENLSPDGEGSARDALGAEVRDLKQRLAALESKIEQAKG
jgi:hypothetical protein